MYSYFIMYVFSNSTVIHTGRDKYLLLLVRALLARVIVSENEDQNKLTDYVTTKY